MVFHTCLCFGLQGDLDWVHGKVPSISIRAFVTVIKFETWFPMWGKRSVWLNYWLGLGSVGRTYLKVWDVYSLWSIYILSCVITYPHNQDICMYPGSQWIWIKTWQYRRKPQGAVYSSVAHKTQKKKTHKLLRDNCASWWETMNIQQDTGTDKCCRTAGWEFNNGGLSEDESL